jgi:hypothetical protein
MPTEGMHLHTLTPRSSFQPVMHRLPNIKTSFSAAVWLLLLPLLLFLLQALHTAAMRRRALTSCLMCSLLLGGTPAAASWTGRTHSPSTQQVWVVWWKHSCHSRPLNSRVFVCVGGSNRGKLWLDAASVHTNDCGSRFGQAALSVVKGLLGHAGSCLVDRQDTLAKHATGMGRMVETQLPQQAAQFTCFCVCWCVLVGATEASFGWMQHQPHQTIVGPTVLVRLLVRQRTPLLLLVHSSGMFIWRYP